MGRAHKLLSQEEQQLLSLSLPLSQITDHTSFLLTGATADSSGLGFSRKFVCFSPPALPLSRHGFLFFCCPPLPPALSTRPHPNDDLRSPADKPSTCPGRIPNSRAAALLSKLYFETGVASPLQQNRTRHQRAERRGGSQVTSVALLLFAKRTNKIFGNATLGVDLWSDICGSAHTGLGRLSRRTCGRSHRSIRSGSTAAGHHAEKWS